MSLIEVLVTISLIGLLVALALPAVQRARASARKMECTSRLREISRGTEGFHAQHGRYPGTLREPSPTVLTLPPFFSIHCWILPHIEQRTLFQQVDFNEDPFALMTSPPSSTVNAALLKVTVPLFQCPSDMRQPGSVSYRASAGTSPGLHESILIPPPAAALRGLVSRKGRRAQEIRDGLSQTVGFAERLIGSHTSGVTSGYENIRLLGVGNYLSADDAAMGCQNGSLTAPVDSYLGTSWLPGGYHTTWYNHVLAPNAAIRDCTSAGAMNYVAHGAVTARSAHDGGVTVAMMDGSCRFVNSHISLIVWRAVGTVCGRETVTLE